MKLEDFAYIVDTEKSFDNAVVSVLKSVEQKGWSVFQIYDIKERLAAKGFDHKGLKIIEICSAKHANKLLNKNRMISLCMPCKINIIEEDGKIRIAGMNPSIASAMFANINIDDLKEAENDIKEIIDASK